MRQTLFFLALSLMIVSCGDEKKKVTPEVQAETTTEMSKIGRTNYAVVWNWTTDDVQLVTSNLKQISEELTALWQQDVVENAYYNNEPEVNKLGDLPNISFFLKAQTEQKAREALNNLTIVRKGLSDYTLYPVGNLWLERNVEAIKENGFKKSFVTIWSTTGKPTPDLTKSQNDEILALWNKGVIENVYFDIEGTQKVNEKTDFVFYINADNKEEAIVLCDSLPFLKNNVATYKLHPVGIFWLAKYASK